MEDINDLRQKVLMRWGGLKNERSSWMAHWQEISTYLMPRNSRFFRQDRNKGDRRDNKIYDNTAFRSLCTLGAGLLGGATSPARPWFRLGAHDTDLNNFQPVKLWLDDLSKRMHLVFQKSNTYRTLHKMYLELGAFGTATSVLLPDFGNVIHHYPLSIGEYALAQDAQGKCTTIYREFEMPVVAMVKEYGYDNCSKTVQSLYDQGKGLDQWVPLIWAIEPRSDRDPRMKDSKNMAWSSLTFELNGDSKTILRESGFPRFPGLAVRWDVTGGDIYGTSPAMGCLGDIKQLQLEQLRKSNAIDFQTNPPLQVPSAMKNQEVNRLPGGITYIDPGPGGSAIKSAFDVNLNLQHLLEDIGDVRNRVKGSFFADLFVSEDGGVEQRMTATEVAVRREEKMLMMGPVMERLDNELLTPLVETTFTYMLEAGMVPPAPPDLRGKPLSVEFVSMLAQAQRAVGTNSIDRFTAQLAQVATLAPQVVDKFDPYQWADTYSDMLGVDPRVIVGSDQAAQVAQARAKAQAAQAQVAAMQQQSQTAKNLAQSPTGAGGGNALGDMLNQFSGYGSPSPQQVQ